MPVGWVHPGAVLPPPPDSEPTSPRVVQSKLSEARVSEIQGEMQGKSTPYVTVTSPNTTLAPSPLTALVEKARRAGPGRTGAGWGFHGGRNLSWELSDAAVAP